MKTRLSFLLSLFALALSVHGSSVLPLSTAGLVQSSAAVFRGTVVGASSTRSDDGLIYTATSLRVEEGLRGVFPSIVKVVHRGGRVGNQDEFYGLSPKFGDGQEYLLFVVRGENGGLNCVQGAAGAVKLSRSKAGDFSADSEALLAEVRSLAAASPAGENVTDQAGTPGGATAAALTGMLGGVAARFTQPDRGEPIPYLIDADNLPAGMTLTQATNAVRQALNAWTAVTSLKFAFEGFQSFGQGADTVAVDDGRLRIQLHDNYNRITAANVLGVGGRYASTLPVATGWDLGGNIAGNEFMLSTRSYVVLERTNTAMQNLSTFTEVLCHEIGHTLNLAHSSENPSEANTTLKQAMMYFQIHADGRGATLGAYDPPVIQQIYPSNTAPYSYDRVMDVTTSPFGIPNVAGINSVELRGYDLQSSSLTIQTNDAFDGVVGVFSLSGNLLKFNASAYFGDARIPDLGDGSYYERIFARFSDGTNASPYITVRTVSHNPDSTSPASDGLPDDWMTTYFGHSNPLSGDKSRATDDADSDKLNNLQEYIAGMIPTNKASAQLAVIYRTNVLEWQAKAYELYEVQTVTNIASTNWARLGNPVLPLTNTGRFTNYNTATSAARFFRVQKVP
ncbi:MAG: matrixin family metalloprotease [Verrucomicrobiota bacterium]